jgi:hypothetical protein
VGRLYYRTFKNVSGCELEEAYSTGWAVMSRGAEKREREEVQKTFGTTGITNILHRDDQSYVKFDRFNSEASCNLHETSRR